MKVLSLFDGMSCGRTALKNLKVPVMEYVASEIEERPMQVAQDNHPDIIQVGDVRGVLPMYQNPFGFEAPDLLLAGSPCQGFSRAGKGLNFEHPESKLFFEFVEIWKTLKPKFWLLENVVMKQEWQDVITEILGTPPLKINSKIFTPISRPRLYWTNIPQEPLPTGENVAPLSHFIDFDKDSPINTPGWHKWWEKRREYSLSKGYSRILNDAENAICQTANQVKSWDANLVRVGPGQFRFFTVNEAEKLHGLEPEYTAACLNYRARYKMLGNGWHLPTIQHILQNLRNG